MPLSMPCRLENLKDHCHTPLRSKDSIRVLDLLPSRKAEAPIECILRDVPLSGPPKYEALSYVWGSPEGTQPISCDGMKLLVTPNCLDALVHLRRRFRKRTLWIDAICINQRQDDECNHQVGCMGDVYSRASRVIIWFGLADASTPKMVKFAEFVFAWSVLPNSALFKPMKWLFRTSADICWYDADNALKRARDHPWFQRLWTVQEVAFARVATVMIGHHTMMLEQLNASIDHPALAECRAGVRDLLADRTGNFDPTVILSDLLRALPQLDCKLVHDRIFGLYSVLIRAGLNLPEPDYGRPVSHVFQEVVASFIEVTGSLTPLYMTLPAESPAELPSWVPNWLTYCPEDPVLMSPFESGIDESGTFGCRYIDSFANYRSAKFGRGYFNGKAASCSKAQAVHVDIARGKLELKGTHISKITQRLACLPRERRVDCVLRSSSEFFQVCQQWCRFLHLSMGESSIKDTVIELTECISPLNYHDRIEGWFYWMLHSDGVQIALIAASEATRSGYLQHLFGAQGPLSPSSTISEISDYLKTSYQRVQQYLDFGANYAFIALDSGQVGRAHYTCQEGDGVYLFAGCKRPMILRPHGDAFRVVAPAHIMGLMDGELWPDDESTLETITLV